MGFAARGRVFCAGVTGGYLNLNLNMNLNLFGGMSGLCGTSYSLLAGIRTDSGRRKVQVQVGKRTAGGRVKPSGFPEVQVKVKE